MERFRGTDSVAVNICNRVQDIIRDYTRKDTKLDAILYLGIEEMYAIKTIEPEDISINIDLETGEIELYGFKIVPVMRDSYAVLCPSIMLNKE